MSARASRIPRRFALLLLGAVGAAWGAPRLQPVDVFVSGAEGYHTYRIPSLAVSAKGTLLAFCEGRKSSRADRGDIDLVLKRSFDGGTTWSGLRVVQEEGGEEPITIGNPCVIATPNGAVHLLFCRNNRRAFAVKSLDDGATFSAPKEITEAFRGFPFAWSRLATGPGHGIRASTGRLAAPIWLNDRLGGEYRSGVLLSDDGGTTWKAGGLVPALNPKQNECAVAEVAPGELFLNARSELPTRTTARSLDGGQTWADAQSGGAAATVCQGSLVALWDDGGSRPRLLSSLPAGPGRQNLTVRRSDDGGATWPHSTILSTGPAGYSDLAHLGQGRVGCLYERGERDYRERISFTAF